MKLSTRCRYATLALFDIAFHSRGEPTQVRQIAERQDIPVRFLEQIFQDLKRAELVDGKRGRNGGYYLKRAPEEISLADVVRATDGPLELSFCASDDGEHFGGDGRSVPAAVWSEVSARVNEVFAGFTMADLVARAEAAGLSRDPGSGYMYFI
jgi:Rrf2 family protein